MSRTSRLIVAVGLTGAVVLAARGPADALTPGPLACQLGGGNGIVLTLQVTLQGDTFALVGQWDDLSLSPLLPVYGAALVDPNFDVVGGLTYVGFSGRSMPRAPFGARPRGVHVQFRLSQDSRLGWAGQWADDRGGSGTMTCVPS